MPPITPEQLAEASTRLDKLTQKLEKTILDDICRRIAKAGTITDTAEWQMMRLKEMGYANEVIEKAIADYTKMSEAEIRQLFFEAGQVSDDFYEEVYSKAGMPFVPLEENPYMQQFLSAGIEQTNNELVNFTQSMGFAVRQPDGSLAFQGVAETYQSALDLAQMQVATGVFDYTTAIRNATKSLTDSGLQFVDYASGHRNRADVAARRAVLTGISQMTGKIAEHNMDELGTEYVEVTAHAGARPDHAVWQGKIYRWKRGKSLDNGGGSGIINIRKSVEIPKECIHILKADTNFKDKNVSADVIKTINNTIDKRLAEKADFVFNEIKVGRFQPGDKSVFITNLEDHGSSYKTQLYLNKDYFIGSSEETINSFCTELYNKKWWKSKSLGDLVNHEIMHAKINYHNSYEKIDRLYQTLREDYRVKGFCGLVDKYPDEFLNEMYVALNNGEAIDKKYITVYNEYVKEFLGG